jgi:hypothetical protein
MVKVDVPDRVWQKQLWAMKAHFLSRINELWGVRRITEITFTYENH